MKIEIIDITKVADLGRKSLLAETVQAIESHGPTYRDTSDLNEHLYRIEDILQDEADLLPIVKSELESLSKILDENDVAYIRFID